LERGSIGNKGKGLAGLIERFAVGIQKRRLGLMLALWASVRSVWVGRPSHIKTTIDLGFSHAITLKLFCILRAQVILKVVKGFVG
jgi:hypothetical protein